MNDLEQDVMLRIAEALEEISVALRALEASFDIAHDIEYIDEHTKAKDLP